MATRHSDYSCSPRRGRRQSQVYAKSSWCRMGKVENVDATLCRSVARESFVRTDVSNDWPCRVTSLMVVRIDPGHVKGVAELNSPTHLQSALCDSASGRFNSGNARSRLCETCWDSCAPCGKRGEGADLGGAERCPSGYGFARRGELVFGVVALPRCFGLRCTSAVGG